MPGAGAGWRSRPRLRRRAVVKPSAASSGASSTRRVGTLVYTKSALLQVMFWLLWGDFFFQLFESLTPSLVPLQLRWEGASDTLIGLLGGSLSHIFAIFWCPIVGTHSDHHRGPLGRRRPFLLWCTIPVVVSLVMVGAARPAGRFLHDLIGGAGWGLPLTAAVCTIAWIAVWKLVFFFFNTYVVQVFHCLVADVVPGGVMGKFTGAYRAIGAIGSLVFNRWVLGYGKSHTFEVYAIIAGLFALAFFLIVWRVKEGEYPPPPPRSASGSLGAVKGYLRQSFLHPFYLSYYCISFFAWASLAPLGFIVFFATEAGKPGYAPTLGLSLDAFGKIKGWTFLVQIPVFFVVGHFVDRFHPLRVAIVGVFLTTVTYFCCFWFARDGNSLLFWWCVNQAAIAIFLGAVLALAPRILPRDKFGQFVSANGIFGQTSLIVAPTLVGVLLEQIRDYRYTFVMCGVCMAGALVACCSVFLQWRRLGGDESFTPPET